MKHTNEMVLAKIQQLNEILFRHDGFGEMKVEMKILKKGQKEVIIHCGKQYRYVVDYPGRTAPSPGEVNRLVQAVAEVERPGSEPEEAGLKNRY
ncbi:MAG: hypothetical protein K6U04_02730 [Armatimonadetes bacterium]|nr:hypothetical protein [Armatimonadota bacterium]